MANNVGSALSTLLTSGQTFYAPFADKGSGEVSLVASGAGASQSPTFTRATTATTVNSAGLIVSVPLNLHPASADMANASYWSATRASWPGTTTTAPDGTSTAQKLVEDSTAANTHLGLSFADVTVVTATTYTTTVFAKAAERTWFALQEGQGVTATAYFNLSSGTVGTVSGTGTPSATITSYPNGWYRCSLTFTSSGTAARIRLFLATADNTASYSGNGTSGAFFWGAQLELGSSAGVYCKTTTTANSCARSYYDPTTLAYRGYLAEGARTNLCLQSEVLGTTWTPFDTSTAVTSNAVVSPDGATTADKIYEADTVAQIHRVQQNVGSLSLAVHTVSAFFKAGERTWAALQLQGTSNFFRTFNLSTGALGTTTDGTSTSTITAYPNGWYRCTLTGTITNATQTFSLWCSNSDSLSPYAGVVNSGVYAWGAQLEAASFASSYIPTTTASVTRNSDVLTYPFSGNASDTAGSAYAEMLTFSTTGNGTSSIPLALSASGLMMYLNSSDARTASNLFDGTNSATKTGLSDISTAPRKRGCSWGGSGLINTGDGLTPATSSFDGSMGSTSIAVGSTNAGASQWFGTIRNVRIYQTQLSAAQLQTITT